MHIIIWIIVILVVLGLIISLAEWVIDNIVPILLIATYIVGLIFMPKIMVALTGACIGILIVLVLIRSIIRWIKRNIISRFKRKHHQKPISEKVIRANRGKANVTVDDNMPEDVREIISNGNRFLTSIRMYSDEIEDVILTKKLGDLEGIIYQILCELKRNPDKVRGVERLNNYYIPTIEKLVRSYAELDKYEYQESNVQEIKREITQSIDDVNSALLKLVNDLFVYEKIDIQSDVAVMKQMLKRDGILKE